MLKHYFITAYRNLLKRTLFTLINLIGLSVGVATFLVLINYVEYEFSYDTYLPDSEQIYRVDYYENQNGETVLKNARSHTGLSTFLRQNFPEVKSVAKAYNENCLLFNDKAKGYQKGIWADSAFLNVFKIKILEGSREKALVAPFSIAISRSLSLIYFGKGSPIGKILHFNEHIPFTVTAVFDDVPSNSSVKFNFLVSMTTLFKLVPDMHPNGDFGDPWVFTYLILNRNVTNINNLNARLKSVATENISSLKQRNLTGEYKLRPVSEIHFSQDMAGELEPGKAKLLLHALISVAIFILLAAWVNYFNLSMAQTFQRAEEIMVRKVYGASENNISSQFMAESAILAVMASLSGFIGYRLLVKFLSGYLSQDFSLTQTYHTSWIWYNLAILLITMLSAIFPAKIIAKYKPAFILRKQYKNRSLLKNGLLIFQLLLSIFTIGCTIIAYKQINYMHSFNKGFNEAQTISLRGPASRNVDALRYQHYTAFRDELLSNSKFSAGTASMNIPGEELRFHDESIHLSGSPIEKKQTFWISNVDDGYLKTFGLKLLAGRNLVLADKGKACLVNEAAIKALGFNVAENAINAEVLSGNKTVRIIGVVQDFHHESLKKRVEPVLFYFEHPYEFGYYTFKITSSNRDGVLEQLQQIWKKHYPDDPFVYYFLDSFFAKQYADDELFGKLLGLFSVMSVLVACLGLFGLASLSVESRIKEIGIRKVLGASAGRIILTISKDYIKLVAISFMLALPLFGYVINKWLQGFSYRVELSWWIYLLPGIFVLLIAFLVVATSALKASIKNPITSLRAD